MQSEDHLEKARRLMVRFKQAKLLNAYLAWKVCGGLSGHCGGVLVRWWF